MVKHTFLVYIALKKLMEKWPFMDHINELTPLEKCQFFHPFNFLLYSQEKRFFVPEYGKTHFPGLYCARKKLKKWPFFYQDHGLAPWEKCQFFEFLNFLYL